MGRWLFEPRDLADMRLILCLSIAIILFLNINTACCGTVVVVDADSIVKYPSEFGGLIETIIKYTLFTTIGFIIATIISSFILYVAISEHTKKSAFEKNDNIKIILGTISFWIFTLFGFLLNQPKNISITDNIDIERKVEKSDSSPTNIENKTNINNQISSSRRIDSPNITNDTTFDYNHIYIGNIIGFATKYIGQVKNNLPEGSGELFTDDGYYHGEFKDGLPNGRGEFIPKTGSKVSGIFKDGELSIEDAPEIRSNSTKNYNNLEKDSKRKSYGFDNSSTEKIDSALNLAVSGNYSNGIATIKYLPADANSAQAHYANTTFNTVQLPAVKPEITYKKSELRMSRLLGDGVSYYGETKNGKANGKGKMVTDTGVYEGEFANGIPNGKGVFTSKGGIPVEGIFKDGGISMK